MDNYNKALKDSIRFSIKRLENWDSEDGFLRWFLHPQMIQLIGYAAQACLSLAHQASDIGLELNIELNGSQISMPQDGETVTANIQRRRFGSANNPKAKNMIEALKSLSRIIEYAEKAIHNHQTTKQC